VGILNGIDTERWNPATDAFIAQRYSADALDGKAACKAHLQRESGLTQDAVAPIIASASRLTTQKMADVALERLPALLARHPRIQFALVGAGDASIEAGFRSLAREFRGRIAVRIGHSEADEHRLHAGADILLHGARFEPCGLAHMYAMRYGALPVVRRVGGLADTVSEGENGFVFEDANGAAMGKAIERALARHSTSEGEWRRLQQRAMNDDFGWDEPAREYMAVYGA
jgi:starch synthase